jgi:cytochrome c oxidase subunit 3/cytochrome o ubiquinol oxidase subunit 3
VIEATLTAPPLTDTARPDPRKVGMVCFLASEAAFFATLIVAYLVYLGQSAVGPTPAEALSLHLVLLTTACLLASSVTCHVGELALRRGSGSAFSLWWGLTILLGVLFLAGTAWEWYELIYTHGLTLRRNLFGTTFYTLVGFHALHVSVGVLSLLIVLVLAVRGRVSAANALPAELTAWYWHFVDGVWVIVFTVVYLLGR